MLTKNSVVVVVALANSLPPLYRNAKQKKTTNVVSKHFTNLNNKFINPAMNLSNHENRRVFHRMIIRDNLCLLPKRDKKLFFSWIRLHVINLLKIVSNMTEDSSFEFGCYSKSCCSY